MFFVQTPNKFQQTFTFALQWGRAGPEEKGHGEGKGGVVKKQNIKKQINSMEALIRAASGCLPRWFWQHDPSSSGGGCRQIYASVYRRGTNPSSSDPEGRNRQTVRKQKRRGFNIRSQPRVIKKLKLCLFLSHAGRSIAHHRWEPSCFLLVYVIHTQSYKRALITRFHNGWGIYNKNS